MGVVSCFDTATLRRRVWAEVAARQLEAAAAAAARAEAERFQKAPGLRGQLVRWLVR